MKFNLLIILIVTSSLFFISCKEDDPIDKTPYSFSAVLTDYVPGTIDSVYIYQFGANMLGKTKIADNGDFSMSIVPPTRIATINSDNFSIGVIVSDNKARIGEAIVIAGIKGGDVVGYIQKSDTSTFVMLTDSTAYEGYTYLMYSDRDFSITGTETDQDLVVGDSAIIKYNYEIEYDLNFKKGWNEIIYQAGFKSVSAAEVKVEIVYNNIAPAHFKWRYFEETAQLNAPMLKAPKLKLNREDILQKALRTK